MKRLYFCLVLILALGLVIPAYAGQGNDAPSGPHFNLNVIGVKVDKPKKQSFDDDPGIGNTGVITPGNGHRIFVPLWGNCKIWLTEGDFQVVDYNGTDGHASFQLPDPEPAGTHGPGETLYSVWVRGKGSGGSATIQTCAYDGATLVCSTAPGTGIYTINVSQKFKDVSRYLLFIYADLIAPFGKLERYYLFDAPLQDYFWDYNNSGLKLAQFRFYYIPTQEPEPGNLQ